MKNERWIPWLAVAVALAAVLSSAWISSHVFENVPHLEDEMAYVWQAKALAGGQITVPSPECPSCFMVPFVVDANGQRSGKYPLPWPLVLSFGERFNLRGWVNPILAGLCGWLMFRLGSKLLNQQLGLLAEGLLAVSPFFLLLSGSLLGHIWTLFLTLSLFCAWLDTFTFTPVVPRWVSVLTAGLALGLLALSRPMTAVGVSLPLLVHGIWLLVRAPGGKRAAVMFIGGLAGFLSLFHFVWQGVVSGDIFQNPYQLWWVYDRIGFGEGVGLQTGGYTLLHGFSNLLFSLKTSGRDVLGWPLVFWLVAIPGYSRLRKQPGGLLVSAAVPALVGMYLFYWVGAWVFGPRYYFEAMPAFVILVACGFTWLSSRLPALCRRINISPRVGKLAPWALLVLLTVYNLGFYLPARLHEMTGLYGITRAQQAPFMTAAALKKTPALVIVHIRGEWTGYGGLLDLEDPFLKSPFIFSASHGLSNDLEVMREFPERQVIHYYTDEPGIFYSQAKDGKP